MLKHGKAGNLAFDQLARAAHQRAVFFQRGQQLEDAMRGVDAQSLRDSDVLREQTKNKVDALLDKFSF